MRKALSSSPGSPHLPCSETLSKSQGDSMTSARVCPSQPLGHDADMVYSPIHKATFPALVPRPAYCWGASRQNTVHEGVHHIPSVYPGATFVKIENAHCILTAPVFATNCFTSSSFPREREEALWEPGHQVKPWALSQHLSSAFGPCWERTHLRAHCLRHARAGAMGEGRRHCSCIHGWP